MLKWIDRMKNMIMKIIKSIDLFWKYLNTDIEGESEKVRNAKQEIKVILYLVPFILSSLLLINIIIVGQKKEDESGTGFIMFGLTVLFVMLSFLYVRKDKFHNNLN